MIYDPYEELTEEVYKWEVCEDTKIETALEYACLSVLAAISPQLLRDYYLYITLFGFSLHYCVLAGMDVFYAVISERKGPVWRMFVGLI